MAQLLVKILSDDGGEIRDTPVWCLSVNWTGNATFCGGEFYVYGESGCTFKTKIVERGGITCETCLKRIADIKNVKL